jgi:16S rRNA (guanine527-N7)-methyltransferase
MSAKLISTYFPELSPDQQNQFDALGPLYADWNDKVNVISRKDIDQLYERHVLHSLGIAKIMKFAPGTKVLDVGTGGGFPGIPLAILFPDTKFHLVDSIGKKIKVVKDIAEQLSLQNVTASQIRAEELKEKFDFVVSRAVTKLPAFIQWTAKLIKKEMLNAYPNGIFYLKGGDFNAEIEQLHQDTDVFELSKYFKEEFFETKKVVYIRIV